MQLHALGGREALGRSGVYRNTRFVWLCGCLGGTSRSEAVSPGRTVSTCHVSGWDCGEDERGPVSRQPRPWA